ncbi:hypothetical protein L4D09_14630 [Photobacterium makurazakiensis]|uniref:hypothetical protein n=1 Tax=Photobacterium makurazakiensis TaxID=2910234 RepID=UPI003D0BE109
MHLFIVFLIVAAISTWWLAEVVHIKNIKMRLFVWCSFLAPLVAFWFNPAWAITLAAFWFIFVLLAAIRTLDSEQKRWESIKPICDHCGKVYANKKHISCSNWSMYTYTETGEPSHLHCYQCEVKHYT